MQLIQPAAGVQCGENLLLRSYLHPFTGAEPERRRKWVIHRGLHSERCVGIWRLQEFSRADKAGRAHKGNEVKQMPRFDPEVADFPPGVYRRHSESCAARALEGTIDGRACEVKSRQVRAQNTTPRSDDATVCASGNARGR